MFSEAFKNATPAEQQQMSFKLAENLLAHPETEVYMNAMGQGREPIVCVINRGKGGYQPANHSATFDRHPYVWQHNHYISQYVPSPKQVEDFDKSVNMSITYEDIFGNLKTNVGPVFGKIHNTTNLSSTTAPTTAPTTVPSESSDITAEPEL